MFDHAEPVGQMCVEAAASFQPLKELLVIYVSRINR